VLVRFDHVARIIVNADHGIMWLSGQLNSLQIGHFVMSQEKTTG
jgi:hypothetical protein